MCEWQLRWWWWRWWKSSYVLINSEKERERNSKKKKASEWHTWSEQFFPSWEMKSNDVKRKTTTRRKRERERERRKKKEREREKKKFVVYTIGDEERTRDVACVDLTCICASGVSMCMYMFVLFN